MVLGSAIKLAAILALVVCFVAPISGVEAQPYKSANLAWKPDGTALAVGYSDGTLEIYNGLTGFLQKTLNGHDNYITALAWHPTDNLLVSGSFGRMLLWDLSTDIPFDFQNTYNDTIAWNGNGSRIFVSSDNSILIWDTSVTPPQLLSKKKDSRIYDLAWSPDWNHVATAVLGNIILRNPSTFEWNAVIDNGGDGTLAWSPDGQWLAASDWLSAIRIWNVASGDFQQERLIQAALFDAPTLNDPLSDIVALRFDANGGELLSVAGTGVFTRWDITTGQAFQVSQLLDAPIWAAKFSPDGTRLAYGGEGGDLRIIDTPLPSN